MGNKEYKKSYLLKFIPQTQYSSNSDENWKCIDDIEMKILLIEIKNSTKLNKKQSPERDYPSYIRLKVPP